MVYTIYWIVGLNFGYGCIISIITFMVRLVISYSLLIVRAFRKGFSDFSSKLSSGPSSVVISYRIQPSEYICD